LSSTAGTDAVGKDVLKLKLIHEIQ
jgi:hypothetical protein